MKLTISKIVGTPTEKSWAQVHTFLPEEPEKLKTRGQFLAVMNLVGVAGGVEIAAAGKELIARLHEEYYGLLEEQPFDRLQKAVEKVYKEAASEAQLEIVAACLVGEVLCLAIVGQGRVLLARKGKVVTVLVGKTAEPTIETASGRLERGDLFLLGTKRFFEVVPGGVIQAALTSGSAKEAAEVLTPAVYGRDEEGLAAVVIANVEKEEMPKDEFRPTPFLKLPAQKLHQFLFLIKENWPKRKAGRSPRSLFTVVVVLFLLLGVSVVLGTKQRRQFSQQEKIKAVLEQAKSKKEEGEAILSLNPAKAREILIEAQKIINQVEEEKVTSEELTKFKQELETSIASVLREHEVEPTLFFDLEFIKKGATASDFILSTGQLVILDKNNSAVYSLGLADKKSLIVAGGKQIEGALQVAAFLPKVFVLTPEGIVQTQTEAKSQSLIIKADKEWGEIVDFQTFGGSLYLLDKKGMIWQYPAFAEASAGKPAFGTKRQWLKEKADFSGAVSMAIDGVIWVFKADGSLWKFLQGQKQAFGIAGLIQPLSNSRFLFTDFDQERLYLLDKENSRIVVLSKSGEYHSQYRSSLVKEADGLVALEKEEKIFLIVGSKIYEIKMR